MIHYTLGHKTYSTRVRAQMTSETEQRLVNTIDTITASKRALCEHLRRNPDADAAHMDTMVMLECSSVSKVNDHLGIGLPMNSFRFTLRAAMHHYFNVIVPEIEYHPFRVGAFHKFIDECQEVLLVFPDVHGLKVSVGDLHFSVNRLNATPTFMEFVLPDLKHVNLFYTLDTASIKRLSEYVA